MRERTKSVLVLGLSLMVVTAALAPYLVAGRLAHAGSFDGFLINPLDGFSYLAKMRQGVDGSWSFHLPYTSEPGSDAYIFLFYLFLGNLARWLNISLLTVYYAARFLAGFAMFSLAYFFYSHLFEEKHLKWSATLLTMFGSGLGWLAVPFGIQASDLSIPESIPFLSAVLEGLQEGWGGLIGFFRKQRTHLIPFFALLGGALPWVTYDLWLSRSHPTLSIWNAQNITLSPPITDYVIGYGLILILAILGITKTGVQDRPRDRLLLAWALSNMILLYMPFNFQRRLTLGLFFPLAGLAVLGLERIVGRREKYRAALILLLILSVPSSLIVIGAGLSGVQKQDPSVIHLPGELEAYTWLDENSPPGALVLASPDIGNRLPAFADVRVLYGHPFETPYAESQKSLVESLYAWEGSIAGAIDFIDQLNLDYVFLGERERVLGQPEWIMELPLVFTLQGVEIYEVDSP